MKKTKCGRGCVSLPHCFSFFLLCEVSKYLLTKLYMLRQGVAPRRCQGVAPRRCQGGAKELLQGGAKELLQGGAKVSNYDALASPWFMNF